MILGIVGHESAKFTAATEFSARAMIRHLIHCHGAEEVVSGRCHLGGVDIWGIEEAEKLGLRTREFPPSGHAWPYYRERNIRIAEAADKVVCIVVKKFPPDYTGMRFPYCYHCRTSSHVKSGGCWTVKYAEKLGKRGEIIEI